MYKKFKSSLPKSLNAPLLLTLRHSASCRRRYRPPQGRPKEATLINYNNNNYYLNLFGYRGTNCSLSFPLSLSRSKSFCLKNSSSLSSCLNYQIMGDPFLLLVPPFVTTKPCLYPWQSHLSYVHRVTHSTATFSLLHESKQKSMVYRVGLIRSFLYCIGYLRTPFQKKNKSRNIFLFSFWKSYLNSFTLSF